MFKVTPNDSVAAELEYCSCPRVLVTDGTSLLGIVCNVWCVGHRHLVLVQAVSWILLVG